MKYIVTWIIIGLTFAPCPEAEIYKELGIDDRYVCSVLHTKPVKENHTKTFTDLDSAYTFYSTLKKIRREQKTIMFPGEKWVDSVKLSY